MKELLEPSRGLTVSEVHARTGVSKRMLRQWQHEPSGRVSSAAEPSDEARARVAAAVADADRRMREAGTACYREHEVSPGQLEEARAACVNFGGTRWSTRPGVSTGH